MPETIHIDGILRSVATEQELLDFANSIRRAGGANVLEALLPSEPGNSEECLIANALNFGCRVRPLLIGECMAMGCDWYFPSGASRWSMALPDNLTPEQREALSRVDGVQVLEAHSGLGPSSGRYFIPLPEHIGNAAQAFDAGEAFQNYVQKDEA